MNRTDIRDFLISRRERLTPETAGLPSFGGRRRVKGLRREEVAMLAGVSIDYYIRLERGNLRGASGQVLDSLATALQLDDAERTHLQNLAEAQQPTRRLGRSRRTVDDSVRPSVHRLLDAMVGAAAFVRTYRLDILAANPLARELYSPAFEALGPRPNLFRFAFLTDTSRDFYPEWERVASDCVAMLRAEVGRHPHDRQLSDLVGELAVHSPDFATMWGSQRVMMLKTGTKRFHHPHVGELELSYDSFEPVASPGLRLNAYTPEPASSSADAFALLGTLAAQHALDTQLDHDSLVNKS